MDDFRETDKIGAMSTKPLFVSSWELPGIESAEKFFSARNPALACKPVL